MMTVPLELPLRASEAAALADLILQMGERQPLSPELRSRLLSRIPSLGLESVRPFMGSLVKDPTHASTYYLAVDGVSSAGVVQPFLLHMALSSAPASAHFAKPILIGRMRPGGGREIVVNAIPFGPGDIEAVRTFGEQVDRGFLPRPQGHLSSISTTIEDPFRDLPQAFEAYAAALDEFRANLAAPIRVEDSGEALEASYAWALWAAIRAGWREGYTIEACLHITGDDGASFEQFRSFIRQASAYTKFTLDLTPLIEAAEGIRFADLFDTVERSWIMEEFSREFPLSGGVTVRFGAEEIQRLAVKFSRLLGSAEKLHDEIRREKGRSITGRAFDLELRVGSEEVKVEPRELVFVMHWLKSQRRAVQLIAPYMGGAGVVEQAAQFAHVARYFQATLTFTPPADLEPEAKEQIARSCSGKLNWRLTNPRSAAWLTALAARMRG